MEELSDDDPFEDPVCESYLLYFDVTSYDEIIVEGILSVFESGDEVSCYGDLTGEIDITVSGGSGNYTYQWSNGETIEDINGLTAGTYTITVVDDAGCEGTATFELNEPEDIVINSEQENILCAGDNDGFIDLSVSGGVPPYTFLWSNGETTEDISSLIAGVYTVEITDLYLLLYQITGTLNN